MAAIAKLLTLISILFICSCGGGGSDKGEEVAQKAQIFQTLLAGLRFDGIDLAGGKVYFYSPGTTTAKAVYIDRDKTTEAANPYTLDANGQAEIYGDGVYDIKVTTAAGVEKAYWYNVSMIDPIMYGVDASSYSSLSDAISAIGANNVELYISDTQGVTTNLTIPSNISLIVKKPGKISISNGVTVTINGQFQCGLFQCFDGAGSVAFGRGSISEVYPEWFEDNAIPGTTDMTTAIQSAISSIQPGGAAIALLSSYNVTSAINISETVKIVGRGKTSIIVNNTATGSAAFIIDGSASAYPYANFSSFSDFSIIGDGSTSGSGIKYNDRAAYLQFSRIYLEGNNHGIWHYAPPNSGGTARSTWGSSYGTNFTSVYAKANYGIGFYDDSTDNPDPGVQFNSCITEQNYTGIDWGSSEVSLLGGVFQADTNGEVIFRKRATILNAYFEQSVADYSGNSIVTLNGYGSSIRGCTFSSGVTANIKHISYAATSVIDGNIFGASGSPSGCIAIYNASVGQVYTGSKIINNIFNGVTTVQDIGTAELYYMDSTGATHIYSLVTSGGISSKGKIDLGASGTAATNQMVFLGYCSTASASNGSLFVDSATGKITFKNSAGVSTALY